MRRMRRSPGFVMAPFFWYKGVKVCGSRAVTPGKCKQHRSPSLVSGTIAASSHDFSTVETGQVDNCRVDDPPRMTKGILPFPRVPIG